MHSNRANQISVLQLVRSLAAEGDMGAAESQAGAITDKALAAEAWHLLSLAHTKAQRWAQARAAIESALRSRPDSRALRFERAQLMDQQGLSQQALVELENLAAEAEDSPQLVAHLARALQIAGRKPEAETKLEAGIRHWPTDVQLHILLAKLRWSCGLGERATVRLEKAIDEFPKALQLRLVAADLLRNAGFLEKALLLLQDGLRAVPESAAFLTSVGVVLDSLQRPAEALPYLRAAALRAPTSAPAKRNLIPTLLRVDEPTDALALCDQLSEQAPNDQQLIAYRATALRMLADPRYDALHDYDRLVRIYTPPPPLGFASVADFNSALATELRRLHREDQRPVDQSLRGGTQTDRSLPRENPVIDAFFVMIDASIKDYISRLRAGSDHPTDRRKSASYRIAGSWSVRLQPGGFHINHVHPMGWVSSAYYVEVPTSIGDDAARPGWLKFGEPGFDLPRCPPNHFVRPAAGTLVLFPSYIWHGTVPFHAGGDRLTTAFDVVPE
jgi:tetratricopeptide (TPR) repeat protein